MTCFICLAEGIYDEHTPQVALRDSYGKHRLSVARRNLHDEHTHARRNNLREVKTNEM